MALAFNESSWKSTGFFLECLILSTILIPQLYMYLLNKQESFLLVVRRRDSVDISITLWRDVLDDVASLLLLLAREVLEAVEATANVVMVGSRRVRRSRGDSLQYF